MGIAVSSLHIVSDNPSSSEGEVLTLLPCSSMGPFPGRDLHELVQCGSFPHEHGSLPWGAVLLDQAAGPWAGHKAEPAPV